jgi:hypothetical protein
MITATPTAIAYSILFTPYLSLHQKLLRSARPPAEIRRIGETDGPTDRIGNHVLPRPNPSRSPL